ncbi:MAG: hypothetical protein ACR2QG_03085 [Gammaproteobacteria bacterium]
MEDRETSEFSMNYLPDRVSGFYGDALATYRQGLLRAFAAMSRLTIHAVSDDMGENAKLKLYDQVEEIAGLAGIDDQAYRTMRNILFENNPKDIPTELDREIAAVMLETIKEILYQSYIRRNVLRKKLRMRRFFATQSEQEADKLAEDSKVLPLNRPAGNDW